MTDEKSTYINTGDISGTGIALGTDVQATVTINQQTQKELLDLIQQLQAEIQKAQIPDGAKDVLLTKAVPEMSQAVQSDHPQSACSEAWTGSMSRSRSQEPSPSIPDPRRAPNQFRLASPSPARDDA